MFKIETVELGSEEHRYIDDTLAQACSLTDYQLRVFFSPWSLFYALANIIYIYYVLSRVVDPPPCCKFNGTDYFAHSLDVGFIIFLLGGGFNLAKKWLAARQEHQDLMADIAVARAVQAGGVAWSIEVSLDERSIFVRHGQGVFVFLADANGGTRLLDLIETEDDPRLVLVEGTTRSRDWRWRQLPGTCLRGAFVTSGPYTRVRTYEISDSVSFARLIEILRESTPIVEGAAMDLAWFVDPPGMLERRIAPLDDTAGPGARSRTSYAA